PTERGCGGGRVDRLGRSTGWPVTAVVVEALKSATRSSVGSRTLKLWTIDSVRGGSEPERSVPWTVTRYSPGSAKEWSSGLPLSSHAGAALRENCHDTALSRSPG